MTTPDDTPAGPRRGPAGTAYLSRPDAERGPGVLVLHSWWGLTDAVKDRCDDLSGRGFVALAPDLLHGRQPTDLRGARAALAAVDPNSVAALCLSSVAALRAASADPAGSVGVVGYSSGASWALWLAARQPASVAAMVGYYGVSDVDIADLRASLLLHLVHGDPEVSEDEEVSCHAGLLLAEKDVTVRHVRGVTHGFAETEAGVAYDQAQAERAWDETVGFLSRHLGTGTTLSDVPGSTA